jgi:hypothetical protein
LLKFLQNYEHNLQKDFIEKWWDFQKLNQFEIYENIPIQKIIYIIKKNLFLNTSLIRDYSREYNDYNDNIIEWFKKNFDLSEEKFSEFKDEFENKSH